MARIDLSRSLATRKGTYAVDALQHRIANHQTAEVSWICSLTIFLLHPLMNLEWPFSSRFQMWRVWEGGVVWSLHHGDLNDLAHRDNIRTISAGSSVGSSSSRRSIMTSTITRTNSRSEGIIAFIISIHGSMRSSGNVGCANISPIESSRKKSEFGINTHWRQKKLFFVQLRHYNLVR